MDCRHAYPVSTAWTIPTASGAYETFMLCTNGPDDVFSCKNRYLRKARHSPLLGCEIKFSVVLPRGRIGYS